jgi:hypothetical protein
VRFNKSTAGGTLLITINRNRVAALEEKEIRVDLILSVRKLTNTTVRGGRYRWYATNISVSSVSSAVAMVR